MRYPDIIYASMLGQARSLVSAKRPISQESNFLFDFVWSNCHSPNQPYFTHPKPAIFFFGLCLATHSQPISRPDHSNSIRELTELFGQFSESEEIQSRILFTASHSIVFRVNSGNLWDVSRRFDLPPADQPAAIGMDDVERIRWRCHRSISSQRPHTVHWRCCRAETMNRLAFRRCRFMLMPGFLFEIHFDTSSNVGNVRKK